MRKRPPDFANNSNTGGAFYDLREDWHLIESSLAKQYGIRIRQHKDMPWSEFSSLVSGLMADTPLGQIVSVRAETDRKVIKGFSPDQRRIYSEWRSRSAKKKMEDPDKLAKQMDDVSAMLAALFGGGG